MKKFFIFGAGGNAVENLDLILHDVKKISRRNRTFFVESSPTQSSIKGIPLISESDMLEMGGDSSYFIVTIADCKVRSRIANSILKYNFKAFNIISSNSTISRSARMGTGNMVSHNTFISNDTFIGNFVQVNYFASISHNCVVGDFVTIGPGARINGHTIIGQNVFIGAGALIKPGTVKSPRIIGDNSTIGMGAVVISNVGEGQTVVGNPARKL